MHYLLMYEVSPDYLARRALFRASHLQLAWAAVERGELVLGGAVGEPVESSLLLFRGESPDVASDFAEVDPYVLNGIVTSWRVVPWNTVAGLDAANPVRSG